MPDDRPREEERRVARRAGFAGEAERYDRVRPMYPDALFDAVAGYGGHGAGARVLEIGPGTGRATVPLVERGWRVQAVEIGSGMAEIARARLGGSVDIRVGAFEDMAPPEPPVDLVLCATAFHWLDPAVRLERIAAALRPGGTLAIIWTRHVRGGTQGFFDAAGRCYSAHGWDDPSGVPDAQDVRPQTDELEGSSRFGEVESVRRFEEVAYPTGDYLDLLRTYSPTIALPESRRTALLACLGAMIDSDHGGSVTMRYLFDLVLARRA